jgi:D-alanine-D-alanine ligase
MSFQVNTDWWKEIFDDVYLLTDGRSVADAEVTRQEVDYIESALNLQRSSPILDLCGGQGRHALELCRRGYGRVTVLDYSDYLLQTGQQAAAQQNLEAQFIQGDARDTGLEPESFASVIVMGGSFGYFVQDAENQKILDESFRILKPGGTFLLDLPDKGYVRAHFRAVSYHRPAETIQVTRHRKLEQDVLYCRETVSCAHQGSLRESTYCIRLYSREHIRHMLEEVGFTAVLFQEDFMDRREKGDYGTMTNRLVVRSSK